ncbi:Phosphoglycerate mutase-like protein AT74 [Linum perenne]
MVGPDQNGGSRRHSVPKRIILVRHGESQGNLDTAAYTHIPDHKIPLTESGRAQAREVGAKLQSLFSLPHCSNSSNTWRVYFYVSPYDRTRSTLREIGKAFDSDRERIIGVREECRVREQDFGNFQVEERMKVCKESRARFGRFFFRFPDGESAADVFDRVSNFLESLWRDIDTGMNRLHRDPSDDLNLVIVTHGLTCRVFLMKWFKWTVEQFELLSNPENCEFRVMQLGSGGKYSLAVHHTDEELREWGLSEAMIADQKWRATASKGDWNDSCPWVLDEFFDPPHESSEDNDEDELLIHDCRTSDPEIKEEVEKDTLALLSEELVLQKLVANETLQRTKSLVAESGIVYSHYKRETEKCIAQMETCEEARERAEAELRVELKATASWERRARELGWSSSK